MNIHWTGETALFFVLSITIFSIGYMAYDQYKQNKRKEKKS